FKTYYRAPRHFYFEFNKDKSVSPDRVVVWGDDAAFHSWWLTTGVHETFPPGSGATAFVTTSGTTGGSVLQIASLLFPQAGLVGTVAESSELKDAGAESISGRPCRKLTGKAQSAYGTGYVTNPRQVTIWIDADT